MSTSARILSAWRRGDLVPSAPPPGPGAAATAEPMGRGESFEAWVLQPDDAPALTIRIPWRAHEAPGPGPAMAAEIAALARIPRGIGPLPLALHAEAATSPIGVPCLVTTHLPGRALAPEQWTRAHLTAHGRLLARLHARTEEARPTPFAQDTSAMFAAALADLERADPHRLAPVLRAAARGCAEGAAEVDGIGRWTLSHGDLCATNIVWEDGRCAYIDFEWAMPDDPARDLAIIGGTVHGGPWYVPMDEDATEALFSAYVEESQRIGVPVDAAAALRSRMRTWTFYERGGMLVHVAARAAGAPGGLHARVLPQLRDTLAATIGRP